MKVIFLDIDGVLNNMDTKDRICGCIGIENEKVELLKEIVDKTGAKIVLTSTWKIDVNKRTELGKYLLQKLKQQHLSLRDCTTDNLTNRGQGLLNWLESNNVENFVILDDEWFKEYRNSSLLLSHFVKTECWEGLTKEKVEEAVRILNS